MNVRERGRTNQIGNYSIVILPNRHTLGRYFYSILSAISRPEETTSRCQPLVIVLRSFATHTQLITFALYRNV